MDPPGLPIHFRAAKMATYYIQGSHDGYLLYSG